MKIIDGKKIATGIIDDLKSRPHPDKFMAAILVGNDPVSMNFVRQKEKVAKELGVDFRLYNLMADLTNDLLRDETLEISGHGTCGGVVVQLPLPEHVNKNYVLNAIPREKDVDVLGERALGAFYAGRNPVLPPAVGTVEKILSSIGFDMSAVKAAVVGLGFLVGKPIGFWLMGKTKELVLMDKMSDLSALKDADVVICGTGQAGLIKPKMLKENATVIDFGYGFDSSGKAKGDFDSSESGHVSYTPTPGGTGPVLVAKLFENFYTLNS